MSCVGMEVMVRNDKDNERTGSGGSDEEAEIYARCYDESFPSKQLQYLNEMRKQNQLCDVVVNVGGRSFHAHRAVLAACSRYYMAMFTSGFKESTQTDDDEVSIEGNSDIFEVLLGYAYSGKLNVTPTTAYDILAMTCYMQMTDATRGCANFILGQYKIRKCKIPVGDAFRISTLAGIHKDEDIMTQLTKASDGYIGEHFQRLENTEVFLQEACVEYLEDMLDRELLTEDEITVAEEEKQVLTMVISWLKHDWETRHTHAHRLLQKVRLGLVPVNNLKELIDTDVLAIPECKAMVDSVLQLLSSKRLKTSLALEQPQMFTTRSTITVPISIASGMGTNGLSINRVEYYSADAQRWKTLKKFATFPGANHSIVVAEGKLYAIGALERARKSDCDFTSEDSSSGDSNPDYDSDAGNDYQTRRGYVTMNRRNVYRYNIRINKWMKLPSMNRARCTPLLVHLNGFIYAIAGSIRPGAMIRHVERYSIADNTWVDVASLPERYHRMCAVAFQDKIFVHGWRRNHYSATSVLQVYDPDTTTWQVALSEECEAFRHVLTQPPALFVYKDVCYQIKYRPEEGPVICSSYEDLHTKPKVNTLQVHADGEVVTVTVGEDLAQDHIPYNGHCAFRIGEEVFFKVKGYIYKAGMTIGPDQTSDISLAAWKSFKGQDVHSNIALFTFDRKLLL